MSSPLRGTAGYPVPLVLFLLFGFCPVQMAKRQPGVRVTAWSALQEKRGLDVALIVTKIAKQHPWEGKMQPERC